MSTLTDRYVWGVLRAVPHGQRTDLEPEIRALVADAVEAQAAGGADATAADATAAERAALIELGDPELLAARYTGRTLALIGPRYYGDWRRLLSVLLPIVVPIVAITVMASAYVAGKGALEIAASGLSVAFNVGVQLAFWMTVVFAILERSDARPRDLVRDWTPDELPELPATGNGPSAIELVVSVVALAFGAILLVWQQAAMPITIDGTSYPLFDPALWSFWLPWFLAVIGLELVFTVAIYLRGRWTWPFAVANAALGAAFAIPAVWLLQTGQLFDPGLVAALEAKGLDDAFLPGMVTVAVVVLAATAWDAVDGFRKARAAARGSVSQR
jgi:hypothetical protein